MQGQQVRFSETNIADELELIQQNEAFCALVNALQDFIILTNTHRKIVYVNKALLQNSGLNEINDILGKRPGEVISCINQISLFDVCGYHTGCQECELNCTLLSREKLNKTEITESKIIAIKNGRERQYDYQIISSPLKFSGHFFVLIILKDISEQKRKQALERIFFHDIINQAGSLHGVLKLLEEHQSADLIEKYLPAALRISSELKEEIAAQRNLNLAELGELAINMEWVNTVAVLKQVEEMLLSYKEAENKYLIINPDIDSVAFKTDRRILERILLNMGKNALEASMPKDTILIDVIIRDNALEFSISNAQAIPSEIQNQIFHRSFSTKGINRGLGTYSMILLGEEYLGGKVWFESSNEKGTKFFLLLPL